MIKKIVFEEIFCDRCRQEFKHGFGFPCGFPEGEGEEYVVKFFGWVKVNNTILCPGCARELNLERKDNDQA